MLTVLNMLLKKAVEWDVLERMPCAIKLLPCPKRSMGFHDFDRVRATGRRRAQATDRDAYLMVLWAVMRDCGWARSSRSSGRDIDLGKRQVCVQRSDWQGHVTVPKGGRLR